MNAPKQAVFFGELLMRLATRDHQRFVQAREFDVRYTGAEANAAVTVAHFGLGAHVVSMVPDTEIGDACIAYIRQFGVHTDFVLRGGERLGTYYLEIGAAQRPSKVIYDRAGSSICGLEPGTVDWNAALAGKHWFHWSGTAPALSGRMMETTKEACQAARRLGLTVSCDLNYRAKLWAAERAREVITPLMEWVDVLIGGKEDAALLLGVSADSHEEAAAELHRRFGFRYVAMTLREGDSASENSWACMLSDGSNRHFSRRYQIQAVDRVGAGDAFSGALIYALLTSMDTAQAVEFAAAASCLKHSIPGDFNHVSKQEVYALMRGAGGGRIER